MILKREQFPTIYTAFAGNQSYLDRFDEMLEMMNTSLEQGFIRNTDLNDVKNRAGRFAEGALNVMVSQPYINQGRWEGQPKEVLDVNHKLLILGIHSLTGMKKRIDGLKVDNDCARHESLDRRVLSADASCGNAQDQHHQGPCADSFIRTLRPPR